MQTGRKLKQKTVNIQQLIIHDRAQQRKKYRILFFTVVLIILVSLCVRTTAIGFISPAEVFVNIKTWIHLRIAELFNWPYYLNRFSVLAELETYVDTINRLKVTAITFICGMLLALSGTVFQCVFRNPIAAPTMLGVSSGVKLGILVLVIQYSGFAYSMPMQKYEYCYIGAAVMLILVIVAGKLSSGKNKFSVFDLLLSGAIISQLANAIIQYYVYGMENDQALIFKEISNAVIVNTETVSFIMLGIVSVISIIPIFLIRFSFNAICFDNDESRSMGINSGLVKIITLIIGTLMITAAMVHCGSVGMISLIVPFISRAIFGADFRDAFWGNVLIGGGILVLCRDIVSLIPFGDNGLPIGTIVEFMTLPVFVIILISQRRVWE